MDNLLDLYTKICNQLEQLKIKRNTHTVQEQINLIIEALNLIKNSKDKPATIKENKIYLELLFDGLENLMKSNETDSLKIDQKIYKIKSLTNKFINELQKQSKEGKCELF